MLCQFLPGLFSRPWRSESRIKRFSTGSIPGRQVQTLPLMSVERVGSFLTCLELLLDVTDWTPSGLAMHLGRQSAGNNSTGHAAQITADKLREWCHTLGFQPQIRVIHAKSTPGPLRNLATI